MSTRRLHKLMLPNLEQGHLLLIDCDERSQASLDKSLQRLGIHAQVLHQDSHCPVEGCLAAILEVEHFASPRALEALEAASVPIIALSAHETLSHIQRALQWGATALLNKPITQGSVYTTLMMAVGLRAQWCARDHELFDLQQRLAQRPLLAQALARLMVSQRLDEAAAYERLRSLSMQLNRSIESLCTDIVAERDEGRA
jgi:AmiR/NasT family two-component response regulator